MHRPAARRARLLAGSLIAAGALGACGDDGPAGPGPQVVAVAAQPCRRPTRDLGVGVVVGPGEVLTAAHTVDGPRRAVTVDDRDATIVSIDARRDLALLSAPVDGPAVQRGGDANGPVHLLTLDRAPAVHIVRTGPLVVHDATTGARHERDVHTLVPAVVPGTSGAPVLDGHGRLVGIVVLDNIIDGTTYAVTSAEIESFLRQRSNQGASAHCVD